MKLIYNPRKNPMGQSKSFSMAKVTLKVGENELTERQEKALTAHPDYQKFIDLKVFLVGEVPVEVVEVEAPKRTTRKKMPTLLDL